MTEAQIAAYERDGFVFPLTVFTKEETASWADEVLAVDAAGLSDHPVPWVQKTYLLLPSLDNLLRDPRLTGPVASILGDDLLALSADVFIKPPGSTRRITWHQDVNYWQLEPLDVLTAWVALTPARPNNGAMRYSPASHRSRIEHVERPEADNMLSRGQELAVTVDENNAVDVVLGPGDVSFHHALTPHFSGPNLTERHRIGFAIRFAPTRVRQLGGPPISARLARGSDAYGHFALETGPEATMSPNALAAHRRALEPHAASRFSTV